MKRLKLATLLIAILFFNSCSDDDDPKLPKGDYEKGYFITNEGPFQNGSGTITFVGDDGIVSQDIYKTVNGEDLGNIVSSMTLTDDNAYIIVNNSNRIIVANRYTMKSITVIEGDMIKLPKYMAVNGGTGYVSNWGDPFNSDDDFIAIIDLNTNTVSGKISVGEGPENLKIVDDKLFVTLEGGYSQNNKVVVINTNNNTVEANLTIGDVPNSIDSDGNGNVWVLCQGNPNYATTETAGSLYKIKVSNLSITNFDFDTITDHPTSLTVDANELYYNLNGKVYAFDVKSSDLPTESIIGFDGYYYAMKTNNGELYATDAKDYASEGTLKVFDLTSNTLLETFKTGIIPGDIVFQN